VRSILRSGLIELEGSSYCLLLRASGTGFSLRSDEEQAALVEAFGRFLNALAEPIEIVIRSEPVELAPLLARLDEQAAVLPVPALADAAFTHSWGGCLGIPRDWCASVGLDRSTGIGWAGGYVGDGVATTNLSGRTLRDLVLGRQTELTELPWVNHRSGRWEPEPLRWLGVNAGLRLTTAADVEERLTGRGSVLARALAPLTGGH